MFIYLSLFVFSFEENGYDNINYIGNDVLTKEDLADIGIVNAKDIAVLIESLRHRENRFKFSEGGKPVHIPNKLEDWLTSIDLLQVDG